MATPEQASAFSDADAEFANRLLRADEKNRFGISTDLERPTRAENGNMGEVRCSWRLRRGLAGRRRFR